jgi:hypothetical protein
MATNNAHAYAPVYRALAKKNIEGVCYNQNGGPAEYGCPLETIAL